MPTFRSPPLLLLLPLPLLSLLSLLAQAARAMLPASSRAAAFIIRARRKTISSLGGRTPPEGGACPELRGSRAASRPAATGPGDTSGGTLAAGGAAPEGLARTETRSLSAEDSGPTGRGTS